MERPLGSATAWWRRPPGPAVLVPLGLAELLAVVWAVLNRANPYVGHDEAVYAGRARSLVTDLPAAGWEAFRPPGLPLLGAPVMALGGGLPALRVLGLLLAAATLGLVYLVLARWSGRWPAAVGVLLVLSGGSFLRRLPEFLTDLPAAGLLLAFAVLLARVRRGANPALLLLAAVVAVGAFYLRYAVLSSLAVIAVSAVLVYGPRAWWRDRFWALLAAAACTLGVLPHLLWSRSVTGSPFGVLRTANHLAGRVPPGSGLVWYLEAFWGRLAGWPGTVVMLVGLGFAGRMAWRRRRTPVPAFDRPDERWVLLLVVAALLQVVALGLPSHAEPRYVFFALLALLMAGVHAVGRLAGRRQPLVLGVVGAVALAGVAAATVQQQRVLTDLSRGRAAVAAAGSTIGRPTPGRDCLVVSDHRPELGWYTGCRDAALVGLPARRTGAPTYRVVIGAGRQLVLVLGP